MYDTEQSLEEHNSVSYITYQFTGNQIDNNILPIISDFMHLISICYSLGN